MRDESPLAPGIRFGPYELEAPLGHGGMGEVYRARDTRLDRRVALKLLPRAAARDPRALARFEQEARSASSLSHPNVVTVYDLGSEDGRPWIAMELVAGRSLRDLLWEGPLPLRRAVDLAAQAADGLAAAHGRGLVHRDLKPENLMLGEDGRLKIVDFGIAKLMPSPLADETVHGEHGVRGDSADATRPGTILGTLAYLSPEQARGHGADPRSDQFAFGAVLYEMLAGRAPFKRPTPADTLAAVLREDPPPLPVELLERLPTPLLWVLRRCLAKEPRDRYDSTLDLARDLRELRDELQGSEVRTPLAAASGEGARVAEPRPPRWRRRPALLATVALTVGLAAAFLGGLALGPYLRPAAPPADAPALRYISYSARDAAPSLSRDGRVLAFVSRRSGPPRIWVQLAGGREAALTDGPDQLPRVSPDGTSILFRRDEGDRASLFRVPLVGGPPRKLVDGATEGDWSPDGSRVAFVRLTGPPERPRAVLGIAGADGAEPRELAALEARVLRTPRWSPDGNWVAARVGPLQGQLDPEIVLFAVTGGERRRLVVAQQRGQVYGLSWRNPRELLYAEVSGATAAGSSRVLALDVATGRSRALFGLPGRIAVVDAAGGRIAVDVLATRQALREVLLDAAGGDRAVARGATGARHEAPVGRELTRVGAEDRQPAYSPDGRQLVFSSNRTGNLDLWLLALDSGEARQLTDDPADDWDPAFTPDGSSILWSSNRGGHFEVWEMAADGSGARQVSHDGADAENPTATADGWVVYNSFHPQKSGIWKVRRSGEGAVQLYAGATTLPEVAPDGRHVLFVADWVGRSHGSLRAVPLDGGALVLDTPFPYVKLNDGRPRWLPDGSAFAFVADDPQGRSGIFLQPFVPGRDTLADRRPLLPFDAAAPIESFGIAADGRRLALSVVEQEAFLLLAE